MPQGHDLETVRLLKLIWSPYHGNIEIELCVVTGLQVYCVGICDWASLNWMQFHYHPIHVGRSTQ